MCIYAKGPLMAEIIGIADGGTALLHGIEFGVITIKYTDGEGSVRENEVYCMPRDKQKIIKTIRETLLRNSEDNDDERKPTS